jgi:hypothetical protein
MNGAERKQRNGILAQMENEHARKREQINGALNEPPLVEIGFRMPDIMNRK